MGRNKIKIEPITEKKKRNVTFQKRKFGLFKKAMELSILCDCDIALMIFKKGRVYEYGSKDLNQSLVNYINYTYPATESYTNNDYMSDFNTARPKVKKVVKKLRKYDTINRRILLNDKVPTKEKKDESGDSVSSMEEEEEDSRKSEEKTLSMKQEEFDNFENVEDEKGNQIPSPDIPQHLDLDKKENLFSLGEPETKDKVKQNFVRYPTMYRSTDMLSLDDRYGSYDQVRPNHHIYPPNHYYLENTGYSYSRPLTYNLPPMNLTVNVGNDIYRDMTYPDIYPKSYEDNFPFDNYN